MNSTFLILPHQLFAKKYLNSNHNYVIWEHPHYFTKYKYNKKKLVLHRASMRYYYDYLKKTDYKVKYINFNQKPLFSTTYKLFDPVDRIKLPGNPKIIESPNFLLSNHHFKKYRQKTDKFFFNAFYMWSKRQLDIMPGVKSQDKKNRKTLPSNIEIPNLINLTGNKYVKSAIHYVQKHFPNNYGTLMRFNYPVTHRQAKKWLNHFIENKFAKFGDYQDAIVQDESYLFHSVLSSSINIGLLQPSEIISKMLKTSAKRIKMNSLEGFIRQLFWREYQKYCYKYYNFNNKNYFGNRKKINTQWYKGTLGIKPVDDCIRKGFQTGYLHHIERLMVVGNFMNLWGLYPWEGFKWFMEFSCDSFEWVMHQNVLEMVFFVGGDTMRRPYISSSNYILKMSDYKKDDWADQWDKLYHNFIKKNRKKLHKYRYYFKLS